MIGDIFGDRLKKLRFKKNLLQKEVADDLGITVQRYSSYENNSRLPEVQMLVLIAEYYSVSIDYLLGIEKKTYIDNSFLIEQLNNIKNEINNLEKYINDCK